LFPFSNTKIQQFFETTKFFRTFLHKKDGLKSAVRNRNREKVAYI
jgi:hypothetical protein